MAGPKFRFWRRRGYLRHNGKRREFVQIVTFLRHYIDLRQPLAGP
jgi:hypothetical protein